jgi:hypothetical protein
MISQVAGHVFMGRGCQRGYEVATDIYVWPFRFAGKTEAYERWPPIRKPATKAQAKRMLISIMIYPPDAQ